jgi:two-component system phosphate regulon response regulator PhoB
MHVIKGNRILAVLPRQGAQASVCDILARHGHACTHASTAQKALERIESMRPDVVIIHCDLEDMPGVDLCGKIRARTDLRDMPVIMISERSDLSLRLKGFMAGAQKFLCEPVDEKELLAQVEAVAARARPGAKPRGIAKLIERELKAGLLL